MTDFLPPVVANGVDHAVALFEVMRDPAKYEPLLQEIVRVRDSNRAEVEKLTALKVEAETIAKERLTWNAERETELNRLAADRHLLDRERGQLEAEKRDHAAAVEALRTERAAFEASRAEHAEALAELNRLRAVLRVA
jgi:hypothetical protein